MDKTNTPTGPASTAPQLTQLLDQVAAAQREAAHYCATRQALHAQLSAVRQQVADLAQHSAQLAPAWETVATEARACAELRTQGIWTPTLASEALDVALALIEMTAQLNATTQQAIDLLARQGQLVQDLATVAGQERDARDRAATAQRRLQQSAPGHTWGQA